MQGIVHAVCAGRAATLLHGSRRMRTAFVKSPIEGQVAVGRRGIAADEHVYRDHGGPDMALLMYSLEHYDHWRALGVDLPSAGAMGENLTVDGLTERDLHLGDVLEVGTVRVQVCQPRTPCSKVGARYGRRDLPALLQQTGFTGSLLRVLEPGVISAGDSMRLVERGDHGITVAEAGRILDVARDDVAGAQRLLAVEALGSSARRKLQQRTAT